MLPLDNQLDSILLITKIDIKKHIKIILHPKFERKHVHLEIFYGSLMFFDKVV